MKNWFFLSVGLLLSLVIGVEPTCQTIKTDLLQAPSLVYSHHEPLGEAITIVYTLPMPGYTTLKVFNLIGVEVASLVTGDKPAGSHTVCWSPNGLSKGVYLWRLEVPNGTRLRKFLIF